MTLVFNSSGVVLAGSLSEFLARRGHRDAHLRGALIGAACALPFGIGATLMPDPVLSLLLLGPAFFFGSLPFTLAPAAIAGVTPNQMRAQVTAIYLLFINAFGFGLGPWLMGRLTDRVFADPAVAEVFDLADGRAGAARRTPAVVARGGPVPAVGRDRRRPGAGDRAATSTPDANHPTMEPRR